MTRRLHPRHCTELVHVLAYVPDATGFAGAWSEQPITWHAQVEGHTELAVTADDVAAHTVLTVRVPPGRVLADLDGAELTADDEGGARGLAALVPLRSAVTHRGVTSWVLSVREVLRQALLVYLEIVTGDVAPLFGGWLVTDAVLERSPGRDRHGDPIPGVEVDLGPVVLRPVASSDASGRYQHPETTAELFLPPDSDVVPASTDRVRVPSGPMAGRYQVNGDPLPGPSRTQVQLRRI